MAIPVMCKEPMIQVAFGALDVGGRGWHEWAQWFPVDDVRLEDTTTVLRLDTHAGPRTIRGPESRTLRLERVARPPEFVRGAFYDGQRIDIVVGPAFVARRAVVAGMELNPSRVGRFDFALGELFHLPPDLRFVVGDTNPLFRWDRWVRDVIREWKKRRKQMAGFELDPALGRAAGVKIVQAAASPYPAGSPDLVDTLAVWADHLENAGCPWCETWRELLARCPATWRRPLPYVGPMPMVSEFYDVDGKDADL